MQDNFIQKLNQRASKNLSFLEVKVNDNNYIKTINYLKKQKLLKFSEIFKIIESNSYSNLPFGNILIYKNEIVGFMGTFYSQKSNNNQFLTCNIHSWIVDEKFRINSFYLLSPIISRNIIFTAFTPVKSLVGLLGKLNFIEKTLYYKSFLNLKFFNIFKNKFSICLSEKFNKDKLSKKEFSLLSKYQNKIYYKFIIHNNFEHLLIIGTKLKKKGLNVFNIFYVSNINLFKENWNELKCSISKKTNCYIYSEFLFDISESFFPENQLFSKLSVKKFYIKSNIGLEREDLLNCDIIF